jgi:hypothetical protein
MSVAITTVLKTTGQGTLDALSLKRTVNQVVTAVSLVQKWVKLLAATNQV